jgi:DNA-binding response OmpR family regulator
VGACQAFTWRSVPFVMKDALARCLYLLTVLLMPHSGNPVTDSLRGFHLLVVEDDPLLGALIADFLVSEGATVAGPWQTAQAATESIRLRKPAAALLDVNLLDGDSYGIALILEAHGVPYAFVSGSDPSVVPKGLVPFAFLAKPASFKALLALAQRLRQAR